MNQGIQTDEIIIEISNVSSHQAQNLVVQAPLLGWPLLVGIALFILIGLLWIMKSKKTVSKDKIALVGQRFSGKTQLFISLNQGKKLMTVPSIKNNNTQFTLAGKKYDLCDYCGDHLSKDDIISKIQQFHTIIHVIDGTDITKLAQAAQFIYQVLVNKTFQRYPANYVIFFTKNDLNDYQGNARLIKKIEDEIQSIKTARKNQGLQKQNEQDYLKLSKTRFELKKSDIKIASGNAIDNIKDLQLVLDQI